MKEIQQNEYKINHNIYPDFNKFLYDYNRYIEDIEIIKDELIEIDDNIFLMPNIFTNTYKTIKYFNTYDYAFVYNNSKFILIPAYMIAFYINKNYVFNINIEVLNKNILDIDVEISSQLVILSKNILVEILNFKNLKENYLKIEEMLSSRNTIIKKKYFIIILLFCFYVIKCKSNTIIGLKKITDNLTIIENYILLFNEYYDSYETHINETLKPIEIPKLIKIEAPIKIKIPELIKISKEIETPIQIDIPEPFEFPKPFKIPELFEIPIIKPIKSSNFKLKYLKYKKLYIKYKNNIN